MGYTPFHEYGGSMKGVHGCDMRSITKYTDLLWPGPRFLSSGLQQWLDTQYTTIFGETAVHRTNQGRYGWFAWRSQVLMTEIYTWEPKKQINMDPDYQQNGLGKDLPTSIVGKLPQKSLSSLTEWFTPPILIFLQKRTGQKGLGFDDDET